MRYNSRKIIKNRHRFWRQTLTDRGLNEMEHFKTPALVYPTVEQINQLELEPHRWSFGDKYWKLAQVHYGDPEMWWVIAWFNQKPTEFHVALGESIYVPHPLYKILNYYGL